MSVLSFGILSRTSDLTASFSSKIRKKEIKRETEKKENSWKERKKE